MMFAPTFLIAAAFAAGVASECPVADGIPVRTVELQGLRHTRARVARQEIRHRPGMKFSCDAWRMEKNRLKDLGVFAEVALETTVAGDSVALLYRFRELPPYVPLLTVNKTDQDGFSIGPHIAALNVMGTAAKAHFLARFLGTTEYLASMWGRQLFGRPIEFDAAWIHVNSHNPFDHFRENSHRFKMEMMWPWARHFGITGQGEWFWIRSDTTGITLRPGGDVIPRLGTGLRFDSRDRAALPRRGLFAEIRLTQHGGALGGPADFREWLAETRGYLPLASRQGLTGNALYQYRGGGLMGRYDRFHVGGANTLRGFPVDAFQARNELLLNAEYRLDLVRERLQSLSALGPWSVHYALQFVTGIDGAGLWNHSGPITENFHSGAYVGLHMLVPGVDRVRLEFGSDVSVFQVRVDVGLFEKAAAQRFRIR